MVNVSFLGVRDYFKQAEKALSQLGKDYPDGFKSNTRDELDGIDSYTTRQDRIAVDKTREYIDHGLRCGKTLGDATEYAVKRTRGANCGEQAMLVHNRLKNQGIPHKIVQMDVRTNTGNGSQVRDTHTFCVIGDKGMRANDPATWGRNATIVDSWYGKVDTAQNVLNSYYSFLKKGEGDTIHFQEVDDD